MTTLRMRMIAAALGAACLLSAACNRYDPRAKDEAAWIRDNPKLGAKALPQDEKGTLFPAHPYDAFKGMDGHVESVYGAQFSNDQIKGRNTWVMWSGGNQEFWDYLSRNSNGIVDLLKLCDSRFVRRADRFKIMGVVPHPGMKETPPKEKLGEPSSLNHYGLHLDTYDDYGQAYVEGPPPRPDVYGYASGIVGLRLFPCETDPDPRVQKRWKQNRHKWDPQRYIRDESYYKDPDLVRPYRIGMSCGFCHISANPMNPPEKMHYAQWENLSTNIGSQYFWFGRIFGPDFKRNNLLWYIVNYSEPGALDTSLVATDGNNNPNTMNSIYQLLPRILASLNAPKEQTPSDTLKYMPRLDQGYLIPDRRVVDSVPQGPNDVQPLRFTEQEQDFLAYLGLKDETGDPLDRLPPLGDATSRHTPKVLAGGADSIGGRGALCRVYLNIGEYSTEWRQLHNTMVGITPQRPFRMARAAQDSVNWDVTMRRSTNAAKYLLAASVPMRLEHAAGIENVSHPHADDEDYQDAEGNAPTSYVLPNDHPLVLLGAKVFARDCFVCHSSLEQPDGFWDDAANWKKWVRQEGYVEKAEKWLVELLEQPVTDEKRGGDPFFEGFVKANYLSTDARYHVSEIGTNTARAIADNAGSPDRMWADYSSIDFKNQPRLATPIEIAHPYEKDKKITWPLNTEAGPGRYRPHSLSSMWAHAPYLHNNSVGFYPYEYGPDPRPGQEGQVLSTLAPGLQRLDHRLKIFEDSARRLLGLKCDPAELGYDATWGEYCASAGKYRGYSSEPRRGFDSIVRIEQDAAIELPRVVVPDLIYMQSLALIGIGIPRWVLVLLLLLLLVVGVVLFVKGGRRLREGKGGFFWNLRNIAAILVGIVLVVTVFALRVKEHYRIGYIPKGTPVNLLININGPKWITSSKERKELLVLALIGLAKAEKHRVESLEEVTVKGRPLVDILIELSKCPDLVLDKGHEFGIYQTPALAHGSKVRVSDKERKGLIEFLKKL